MNETLSLRDRVVTWLWCWVFCWLQPSWYAYVFAPRAFCNDDEWLPRVWWCRMRGHPYGVVWYNPGGMEPDMRCKNCGDDLG